MEVSINGSNPLFAGQQVDLYIQEWTLVHFRNTDPFRKQRANEEYDRNLALEIDLAGTIPCESGMPFWNSKMASRTLTLLFYLWVGCSSFVWARGQAHRRKGRLYSRELHEDGRANFNARRR